MGTIFFRACALTGRGLETAGEKYPRVSLWFDTAPNPVDICGRTSKGLLRVYNLWDAANGHGRQSQSAHCEMLAEELENGRRYRCNEAGYDSLFDTLLKKTERG
jgi:hypothetical protein